MTSCEETLSRVCTRGGRACEVAASKGGLDAVRKTLDDMRAAGFPPTVVSYNVAIRMLEPDDAFAVASSEQRGASASAGGGRKLSSLKDRMRRRSESGGGGAAPLALQLRPGDTDDGRWK